MGAKTSEVTHYVIRLRNEVVKCVREDVGKEVVMSAPLGGLGGGMCRK